ncbi:MAG: hypothetical protein FWG87_14620 [Defluviitaleaceae bacterium]|nr:hypothetical protein [Defluviitaleaceae bacterium]
MRYTWRCLSFWLKNNGTRIWWILKAWNADSRGFGGFTRIFSCVHSKLTECEMRGFLFARILKAMERGFTRITRIRSCVN